MRITLRLPDELHESLEREASRSRRSLNSEIVSRLEGGLAEPDQGRTVRSDVDGSVSSKRDASGIRGAVAALPKEARLSSGSASPPPRTGLCEHRVPATSYCARCNP